MRKYKITLYVLIILFLQLNVLAQSDSKSDLDDLKIAYYNIQTENYKDALPYFEKMVRLYPKDPTYNYYLGRCILYVNNDFESALKYLRYASVRKVPSDVYFYLGLTYLKMYQFEDALANFGWFEKSASKKELKALKYDNYKSMAQNGLYLIRYFKQPEVYKKEMASKDDFYSKYDIADLEGRFYNRYLYLNQEVDSNAVQSILFVPNYLERNEILYFSARNKKRGDYDIFRTIRLPDNSWSEPENLGDIINTPFDENYPFIHADGTTLYFASKGHYSMGGYDLYKSSWNWENQEWTEPENIDYPINSPFDDILFVPSPDKKYACFASDRDLLDGKYQVYKIKLMEQKPYNEYLNSNQIREFANLDVNVVEEDKEKVKEKTEKVFTERNIIKVKEEDNFLYKTEYDSLLNLAVNLQMKADSLRWNIDDKRMLFDKTTDSQKRTKLGNEIIELEKDIYSTQKKADACYEQVRVIEQANLATKNLSYEEEARDLEVEDKVQAKENKTEEIIAVEPEDNEFDKSKLEPVIEELKVVNDADYGLRIVSKSSYTAKNPIKINEKLPDGIMYMIQLGAFSSIKNPSVFNGLEPLSCIKKDKSNIHKYFAGKFWQLEEAEKNLNLVKNNGFKDAYIVAFNNGKIVPVKTAVGLESKVKLNSNIVIANNDIEKINDLGILYTIEGEMLIEKSEQLESIKDLLGENQDLFVKKSTYVINFIINSFDSFESAFKIKSKVEGIVQKEVEIHAYFAENQIPLEQARKITK